MENQQHDHIEDNQEISEENHDSEMNLPVITREYKTVHENKVNRRLTYMKPIIIAVVSAVFIGSLLGFFMLNMFTSFGGEGESNHETSIDYSTNKLDEAEEKDAQISSSTLESMTAYVLQGGVFTEEKNANEWAKKFTQEGFPAVIFKENQQYLLFVGIASTEENAKHFTQSNGQSLEVYVKEWTMKAQEIELTAKEQHWLESFQEEWKQTLQMIQGGESIPFKGWNDLVNSYPLQSERIEALVDQILEFYEDRNEGLSQVEWQTMLLSVWKTFDESFIVD